MAPWRKRNGTRRDVQARAQAIRSDIEALQRDMRGMVTDATSAAAKNMNNAVETAGDAADRMSHWSNENIASMRDAVRQQPLTAFALAVSAGALLGAMWSRR